METRVGAKAAATIVWKVMMQVAKGSIAMVDVAAGWESGKVVREGARSPEEGCLVGRSV